MSDAVHDIRMPKLGESIAEGTIAEWMKKVGDRVEFDEPLFLVETDKIATEFPSPEEGVLLEILAPAGATVPVGALLARIGAAGAAAQPRDAAGEATQAAPAQPAAAPVRAAEAGPLTRTARHGRLLSPVVRRLASAHHIDLAQLSGTGAGGRITREDVQAEIARRATSPAASATPAAAPPASKAATAPAVKGSVPPPPAAAAGREQVVPLSRIRLVTAARMVESRRISPHVWTSVEADLENVAKLRAKHKERFRTETGASLSYLPFIMRAVCDALHAYPAVNASVDIDAKTMTLHPWVHLGFAVDLDEQGLIAPVIRNADSLNVRGLAIALKTMAEAARKGTLGPDGLQGSTFTLTNPPLGSYASAPIINQPNVAIMATDGVARRPTAVGDAIAIHHLCILGFSYDHRAFDGMTAARFLDHVRRALQEWSWEAEIG